MSLKGVTLAEKLRLAREAGVSLPHYTNTDNPVDFPHSKTDESINILIKNRNYMKYELIGKLAEQANVVTRNTFGKPMNLNELEKFAELIVRECVSIAQEYDGAKLGGPGLIIAMRIEQHFDDGTGGVLHFGVEE